LGGESISLCEECGWEMMLTHLGETFLGRDANDLRFSEGSEGIGGANGLRDDFEEALRILL